MIVCTGKRGGEKSSIGEKKEDLARSVRRGGRS